MSEVSQDEQTCPVKLIADIVRRDTVEVVCEGVPKEVWRNRYELLSAHTPEGFAIAAVRAEWSGVCS